MTSSGKCYKCEKAAYQYHYNKPFDGKTHDGFWYCEEHSPFPPPLPDPESMLPKRPEYGDGLNRKQRRAAMRKRAKEQRKQMVNK